MNEEPITDLDEIEIEIDGITYVWDGRGWSNKQTCLSPPFAIVHQLNGMLEDHLAAADEQLWDPKQLVQEATRAKNNGQHKRCERLARRALEREPHCAAAATVLSSSLRSLNRPNEAIAVTDSFHRSNSGPLLTTRAAAQCDLGRYPEALRTIRRALAVSQNAGNSAFAVHNRIRAEAPELF